MQTMQLIALIQSATEPSEPVLMRLVDSEVQVCNCDSDGQFAPTDEENWWPVDKCTREDFDELTEAVKFLGGYPEVALKDFPNCISY